MIEIREIKPGQYSKEWLIAIDKGNCISYYTIAEAHEIKRRLTELFPDIVRRG